MAHPPRRSHPRKHAVAHGVRARLQLRALGAHHRDHSRHLRRLALTHLPGRAAPLRGLLLARGEARPRLAVRGGGVARERDGTGGRVSAA